MIYEKPVVTVVMGGTSKEAQTEGTGSEAQTEGTGREAASYSRLVDHSFSGLGIKKDV